MLFIPIHDLPIVPKEFYRQYWQRLYGIFSLCLDTPALEVIGHRTCGLASRSSAFPPGRRRHVVYPHPRPANNAERVSNGCIGIARVGHSEPGVELASLALASLLPIPRMAAMTPNCCLRG